MPTLLFKYIIIGNTGESSSVRCCLTVLSCAREPLSDFALLGQVASAFSAEYPSHFYFFGRLVSLYCFFENMKLFHVVFAVAFFSKTKSLT